MKRFLCLVLSLTMVFSVMVGLNSVSAKEQFVDGGSTISKAGKLSYDITNVSTLSVAREVDWFKFDTKLVEGYYTITYKNINIPTGWNDRQRLNIELTTLSENVIRTQDIWENNEVSFDLKLEKDSTYYFKVYMGDVYEEETGNYCITIKFKEDKEADTLATGKKINPNVVYNCSLDGTGDVDCFKFVSPITGSYDIAFTNHTIASGWNDGQRPNGYFLSQYEEQLVFCAVNKNSTAYGSMKVEKGKTYYVRFRMGEYRPEYTGKYSFIIGKRVTSISLSKKKVTTTPGKKITLKATVKPSNALDKAVEWTTSDSGVCTVSSKGVVKTIAPGVATITCKSKDKKEIYKTCTVTVKPATVTLKSVKSPSKYYTAITIKTVKGASNYEVYYATSKKGKYKKLTSFYAYSGSYTYKTTSLKSRKTYYIKVRAVKYYSGKTINGAFSKIKSVKVK